MVLEGPANTWIAYHIDNSVEGMKPFTKNRRNYGSLHMSMFMYVDMNMQCQHVIA